MEIPKRLKIGGHDYEIVFPYVFTERSDILGQCDRLGKYIRINEAQGDEPRAESSIMVTLIHEVLHAIDHVSGHDMFEGSEGEKRVEALSEGIYQVLVDNGYLPLKGTG